ncbi:hypothetical protein BG004_004979 [Podila humilis]|nr:hypothetical protein BG004_004979 [Podila humilis]
MSAAASRSARATRHGSIDAPSTAAIDTSTGGKGKSLNSLAKKHITNNKRNSDISLASGAEDDLDQDQQHKLILRLKDDLRHMIETKETLDDRVIELEERAQYLEANARLTASMLANENMDLKEKTRKLGIELSTDERDALFKEKVQIEVQNAGLEDEATTLSSQLTSMWIKFAALKANQDDHLKQLVSAQESLATKEQDLAKRTASEASIRAQHSDDKREWDNDRRQRSDEISSLQEKLIAQSKDGGKNVLDWEGDKARLRNLHKQEKDTWAKEKKTYLDQIASFKVKLSSLSVQRRGAAPPDWILEKQKLADEIVDLKSQLAARDNDQHSNNTRANIRKLEKKYAAVKLKLVEVMEEAKSIQGQCADLRAQLVAKNKKVRGDDTAEMQAPARRRPAKRNVDMDVDSEDDSANARKRQHASPSRSPSPPPAPRQRSRRASAKDQNYRKLASMESDNDGSDAESGGSGNDSARNDDTEYRPVKDEAKDRGQKSHVEATDAVPLSKKRSNEGELLGIKVVISSNTASATLPTPRTQPLLVKEADVSAPEHTVAPAVGASGITSSANANNTSLGPVNGREPSLKPVEKIKKKRKLLTGKGLQELGEMLANPDAPFMSMPSSREVRGVHRLKPKSSFATTTTPPSGSLMAKAPNQAKLDALNAIKMQFSIPKAKHLSPGNDRED